MKIQILTRHCRAVASSNIKILYLRKEDNIMLKFEIRRCNKKDCQYNTLGFCGAESPTINENKECSDYIKAIIENNEPDEPKELELPYGPNNPWDAPGMTIHDFL